MRLPVFRRLLPPLFAMLLLGACHGQNNDASQAGGSTPQAALQGTIKLLDAGDFNALWKHALPPADYATMRADWSRQQQNQPPMTAQDRSRFDETMRKLTGPDAETSLYAEIQPKLTRMQEQYQDQIPVLISIGQAMVKHRVEQNQNLSADQQTQLNGLLDVLSPWVQQTAWFDPAKTHQAVGVAVATARKLGLKSADQLRDMDFDTAMAKYSTAFAGARQLLAIYGLSVDDTLKSVRLTAVSNSNGHAVVKVDYVLLGKQLSTESKMVQQDGRWYAQDLLENVRKSHRQLDAPATQHPASAPAVAATAAAKD